MGAAGSSDSSIEGRAASGSNDGTPEDASCWRDFAGDGGDCVMGGEWSE